MKHLTDEQLSARLDGELPAKTAEAAERHLAECAACRERLAALAGADASLARSLERDPGEEYFASFAERVQGRIAAQAAAPASREAAKAPPRRGWFSSPRVLAWAGAAAALVVVGAFAIQFASQRPGGPAVAEAPSVVGADRLESREGGAGPPPAAGSAPMAARQAPAEPPAATEGDATRSGEADRRPATRSTPEAARDAATAPGAAATPAPDARKERAAAAPAPAARNGAAPRTVAPQRLQEVRTLPGGEQVTVQRQAPPKAEAKPFAVPPADASRPRKPMAVPMASEEVKSKVVATEEVAPVKQVEVLSREAAPAPRLAAGAAPSGDEAAGHRVCGTVTTAQGRALAGATVTVIETGRSATSGADGAFCVEAPAAGGTFSVLALGYQEHRGRIAAEDGRVAVQLRPVDTLGPGSAPVARLKTAAPPDREGLSPTDTPGGARVPGMAEFKGAMDRAGITDVEVMRARAESKAARFAHSASQWAKAGSAWTRVASQRLDRDAGESRFMAAEAWANAWRLEASVAHRDSAAAAFGEFLRIAPAGARRDSVAAWQRSLAPR